MTTTVARHVPVQIVKWSKAQRWLPLFIPYALVRALLVLLTKPVELIHISDPVLAPLGLFLRFVGRRPVVVNAHGLDVVYPNRLYQAVIRACIRQLDFVICISEYTRQQCLARGVKAERTRVIPLGVNEGRNIRLCRIPRATGGKIGRLR
jgi:glycosyltransferase involved in cell wall biosynthesis